ncbi:MAG: hypothetical protein FT671_03000 [Pantoea sp. Brub]|nr:hypothetical protein [Pantoea sp. Brub]
MYFHYLYTLDGRHLLFLVIELIKGNPVSQDIQEISYQMGLFFLVILMIFTIFNDLLHFNK